MVAGGQEVGRSQEREREQKPASGAGRCVPTDRTDREQGDAGSANDRHELAVDRGEHRAPQEGARAGGRESAEQRDATAPGDGDDLGAEQQHGDPGHCYEERGELSRETHELGAR